MADSVDPDREDAVGAQTVEKSGDNAGTLVPQPHGGAIFQGAAPPELRKPGPGRPSSAVKAALRADFDDRRELLNAIADNEAESTKERLRALDMMAKYGLDKTSLNEELVQNLADAVLDEVSDPEVVERIEQRWVEILARHVA